jgi:ribonucleoside-diphosphate reductase alpha chain
VFATAVGPGAISAMAHVEMLAAVQAGVSQGVSKTVNLPAAATVEDVEAALLTAWHSGCKAIAIYRDASKAAQPLSAAGTDQHASQAPEVRPTRRQLPAERSATTYAIRVGSVPLYATVGWDEDGRPGEVFLRVAKAGSTLAGLLDALAVTASLALQYGAPVDDLLRHWRGTRFEPAGPTGDPAMPMASSLVDALAQRLTIALGGDAGPAPDTDDPPDTDDLPMDAPAFDGGAPPCVCGSLMVRTGTCWSCPACGASGGCG